MDELLADVHAEEKQPEGGNAEKPPNLDPSELEELDKEAAIEEWNRLSRTGVREDMKVEKVDETWKELDLREVYD